VAGGEERGHRPILEVIPNGVSPERFGGDVAALAPPEAGTFVIGFVGTLKAWHGLPVLAEAFARVCEAEPRARLLIVGDGPERAALEADLERRGVRGAATLTGAVSPAAVPGWLRSMQVAVAPYPALETFYFSPLKVFEYLAAGLPVVASAIGQVTELLEDGVTGVLVPPGDAAALADALLRLWADSELRGRLGGNGRRWVERRHTWDAVVQRIGGLAWPLSWGQTGRGMNIQPMAKEAGGA
jgi:glycosyltransferase involved in cell wall biosynthesis